MDKQAENSQTTKSERFHISELDCAAEVPMIRKSLDNFPGLESLSFNILESSIDVEYLPEITNTEAIQKRLISTGWSAEPFSKLKKEGEESFSKKHGRLILTILSGLFLILGIVSQ